MREFESSARERGCHTFYLETFNFQAPGLYRALGYEVAYEHAVYPHEIIRYLMVRHEPGPA
jgi:ribosomal protein S18 acetylase RimI-like enzyme